ncbi:unnamed protein product, partial [Trichogramma brassicae]
YGVFPRFTLLKKCQVQGVYVALIFRPNVKISKILQFYVCGADGTGIAPMIVYPYSRFPPKDIAASVPDEFVIGHSPSGWMTMDLYYKYIRPPNGLSEASPRRTTTSLDWTQAARTKQLGNSGRQHRERSPRHRSEEINTLVIRFQFMFPILFTLLFMFLIVFLQAQSLLLNYVAVTAAPPVMPRDASCASFYSKVFSLKCLRISAELIGDIHSDEKLRRHIHLELDIFLISYGVFPRFTLLKKCQVQGVYVALIFRPNAYIAAEGASDVLLDPSRIYNLDETGVQLGPKNGKLLGLKSEKNMYCISPGQDKQNITVLCCCGADGTGIAPMIVYPYSRFPPKDIAASVPDEFVIGHSPKWLDDNGFRPPNGLSEASPRRTTTSLDWTQAARTKQLGNSGRQHRERSPRHRSEEINTLVIRFQFMFPILFTLLFMFLIVFLQAQSLLLNYVAVTAAPPVMPRDASCASFYSKVFSLKCLRISAELIGDIHSDEKLRRHIHLELDIFLISYGVFPRFTLLKKCQVQGVYVALIFRPNAYIAAEGASDVLLDPSRIYNLDETGVQLGPKNGKLLGLKSEKNMYCISPGQDKQNITVLCCCGADGTGIAPMIVYPYSRFPPKDIAASVPDEFVIGHSPSGWMTMDLYYKYIRPPNGLSEASPRRTTTSLDWTQAARTKQLGNSGRQHRERSPRHRSEEINTLVIRFQFMFPILFTLLFMFLIVFLQAQSLLLNYVAVTAAPPVMPRDASCASFYSKVFSLKCLRISAELIGDIHSDEKLRRHIHLELDIFLISYGVFPRFTLLKKCQVQGVYVALIFRPNAYIAAEGASDVLLDPSRIYNLDETGVQLGPKNGKLLGLKSEKNMYCISPGQDKQNITVLCCCGADGTGIAPMIVYPYSRFPPKDIAASVPDEFVIGHSPSGWMTMDLYYKYIRLIVVRGEAVCQQKLSSGGSCVCSGKSWCCVRDEAVWQPWSAECQERSREVTRRFASARKEASRANTLYSDLRTDCPRHLRGEQLRAWTGHRPRGRSSWGTAGGNIENEVQGIGAKRVRS